LDGFRALVDTSTTVCGSAAGAAGTWRRSFPELAELPAGLTLDGDLVAFQNGTPHVPLVCDRLLHRRPGIKRFYVVFDLLALDGEPTLDVPGNTATQSFARRCRFSSRQLRRRRTDA
jgi:ATP-dependent DNA ligase